MHECCAVVSFVRWGRVRSMFRSPVLISHTLPLPQSLPLQQTRNTERQRITTQHATAQDDTTHATQETHDETTTHTTHIMQTTHTTHDTIETIQKDTSTRQPCFYTVGEIVAWHLKTYEKLAMTPEYHPLTQRRRVRVLNVS